MRTALVLIRAELGYTINITINAVSTVHRHSRPNYSSEYNIVLSKSNINKNVAPVVMSNYFHQPLDLVEW